MKTRLFLWILFLLSLALSVYAFFFKPQKFDYRTMAAEIVTQIGHRGTLADGFIQKGNHQMSFNRDSQRYTTVDGRPYTGIALYYSKLKKLKAMVEFSEGLPQGRAAVFYNSGKVKETSFYKQGKKEGVYIRFNRYGQRVVEGFFSNGRMNGEWRLLFPDGSIRYKAGYANGVLMEEWFGQFTGFASIPWDNEE